MLNSKIFFSYARSDEGFALKLAKGLREIGIEIWIDQLDILAGLRWDSEIEKALTQCESVIIILSEKAVRSENVMDELSYALEEKKKIIPVKINPCLTPFRIRRIQHIDFLSDYNTGFEKLLFALKHLHNENTEKKPEKSIVIANKTGIGKIANPEKSTLDIENFLSSEKIKQIVQEAINVNEKVKDSLLIYKTKTQHTWLVFTNKQLFCLLDDHETRTNGLIMWNMSVKDARKKVSARQHKQYSGLLNIGDRENWLYSTALFPDSNALVQEINNFLL